MTRINSRFSVSIKGRRVFLLVIQLVLAGSLTSGFAESYETGFASWLKQFQAEARKAGISQRTLEVAFASIKAPLHEVVDRDRNQPESTQTLSDYLAARVSSRRIRAGRTMMQRYPTWLGRIERTYGVQKRFVVALWGIESSYGENSGTQPVIQALVTLAYDRRRSSYFRKELTEALRLLDDGVVPYGRLRGSWAGAMGQCQFMPSSFRHYAVDADQSGSINIWTSVPDVLGSTANYLAKSGWKNDQTWGRTVKLPEAFDSSLIGLETRLPLSRWQSLGVRRSDGRALPKRNLEASLIMPDGPGGPAYLVYDNFRVLLRWNRSELFAVAVGTLSDRFMGE